MGGYRGLEQKHEQSPQKLIRDTRTLGQRFWAFLTTPQSATLTLAVMGATSMMMPAVADIALIIGLLVFAVCFVQKAKLPFRMPQRAEMLDYNNLNPATNKPKKANGIAYFGNERGTNQELWFANEDMRTHVLIFGSTGSGKTETLISLSYNALVQGSGLIYVDGKGDNSLFAKVFSMARSMGREDDVLLINFMTGARDIVGPQKTRLSNTMNPFAIGSSSMLAQLVISMMDSSSASSDGDMWKGRAISFVEALMKILAYARDKGYILLDPNTVRNYFELPKVESIVLDKQFPIDDAHAVSLADAPEVVIEPIKNYLINLPGFSRAKKHKQSSEVLEQHGFITMQLTRVFSSLADTYGHILRTNLAEVDFKDVVLNRRILVVLLPALEKAPDELSNLGKIIVSSIKAMMASGLGEEVEGEYKDVIEKKPTNAPTPFLCVLDEYGYYAVQGFSVVPAQARSLGFSAIFAGQDLPAFQKASKEEAASIGANTNIKIAMKLEDPIDTWDFFLKTAGEADVTKTSGFQINAGSMTNNFLDTRGAQLERRARIDLLDLKDQVEGEMHIFFKSRIVRAKSFFANPKPVKEMRLNQQLKVEAMSDEKAVDLAKKLQTFHQLFSDPNSNIIVPELDEELSLLIENFKNTSFDPFTLTYGILKAMESKANADVEQMMATVAEEEASENTMSIYTLPPSDDDTLDFLALVDKNARNALLDRAETFQNIETLERLAGKSKQESAEIANNLVKDTFTATKYPPDDKPVVDVETFLNHSQEIIKHYKTSIATPKSDE